MNTVALVGRLLISLSAVLGLMWLIARRMKRSGARGKNGKLIELLSRQQLSRSTSIAVVRVLDQALIVGITDGQVSVLGDADLDAVEDALQAEAAKPARAPRLPPAPRPTARRPHPAARRCPRPGCPARPAGR